MRTPAWKWNWKSTIAFEQTKAGVILLLSVRYQQSLLNQLSMTDIYR
jgi:hypothetical protein